MSSNETPAATGAKTSAFVVFAVAFAIIYVVVEQNNWPLFTYHARTGQFGWLKQTALAPNNPAMHWFGWLATSAIGAALVSLAALPLTRARPLPTWPGWAVPLAVMVVFVYLFRAFFIPR